MVEKAKEDMKISELLETKEFRAPDSKWEVNGVGLKRILNVEGEPIIALIEPQEQTFNNKVVDFLNCAFASIDENGKPFHTTTGKNKFSGKIISAAFNAFKEKVYKFQYSAITFVAMDRVDTRINIYENHVKKDLKKFGKSYEIFHLSNGNKGIVIFNDISEDLKAEFLEWLKTQNKLKE